MMMQNGANINQPHAANGNNVISIPTAPGRKSNINAQNEYDALDFYRENNEEFYFGSPERNAKRQ